MNPVGAVPVPSSLDAIASRVDQRLRDLFSIDRARWAALDADLATLFDALDQFVMNGGKRLRPAFCYWGYVGAGGDTTDARIFDIGAAFELLQAFALVHDDVMDGSALRRGSRTTHLAFADNHDVEGWRGEARRFGEGVAILIGDLAHVYADQLLAEAPPAVIAVWNQLRTELIVGQYLDVVATAQRDTDRLRARRIARYKSGKYTIERPLHLGAALGGRLDEFAKALSRYGDPLGEAFQLRDDLLGVFGDETVIGKPVGDDLREGKPTPLLAIATERATGSQAAVIGRVGSPHLTLDDVAEIQAVFVATGAAAEVEALITTLTEEAIDAIAEAPITAEARDALVELAHYVAWRER